MPSFPRFGRASDLMTYGLSTEAPDTVDITVQSPLSEIVQPDIPDIVQQVSSPNPHIENPQAHAPVPPETQKSYPSPLPQGPAGLQAIRQTHGANNVISPQSGPQMAFMTTQADIAIYGGAAGGGKTWALLMEAVRNIKNPQFGAVVFRRNNVQVRNEGGLWDESLKLYPGLGGKPREHDLWWKFPSGASVSFAHLEHDKTVHDWQGSQIPLICFDELTHFSEPQFYYMMSRNRSTSGVRPYIRATCNPDVDSWVAQLIAWWIDQDTGYAIPERSGVLRYFIRMGDKLHWADHPSQLDHFKNPITGDPIPPKSLTFIASKLTDNKVLAEADPGYMANLLALPLVERERLLNGNWLIRWRGQQFFNPQNFLINGIPAEDPPHCDSIYAVLDTAVKSGKEHDGTAVIWMAKSDLPGQHPLVILDWETLSIDGALLERWLPSVFQHGERLAQKFRARNGFVGSWVEDKASGSILIQQALRRGMNVNAIDSKLTSMGKDERAISVSGYVTRGNVKIIESAYRKVMEYKGITRNHLISQIQNFSIGDKEEAKRADDLLDAACYAIAIGLGNPEGF